MEKLLSEISFKLCNCVYLKIPLKKIKKKLLPQTQAFYIRAFRYFQLRQPGFLQQIQKYLLKLSAIGIYVIIAKQLFQLFQSVCACVHVILTICINGQKFYFCFTLGGLYSLSIELL